MDRVVLILGAVATAALVSHLIGRRRPARPTAPRANVPRQLDRNDFSRPGAPWLVAVFTADTCSTCASVWEQARLLESRSVAVQQLEVTVDATIHDRYAIDAVPTLLVADGEGVVRRWFLGPVDRADLRSAIGA